MLTFGGLHMNIDIKDQDGILILSVKGNLMGGQETLQIHEKVKELVEQGNKKFVIDLSKVKWMNSSGLGTMMGCLTSIKNGSGELKICGVTEKVKSLFMITKLITLFDSYDSVEEAVDSFK